ncbi:MAG TPA: prolipoprotein diacylglyceryl transferase [Megamonas funiformis]|jgi:phosphatidylglycerol---prolipoprotein diacylglyceryl transferase|uniref:Phosphatidylglycerol--prolipoprotein diacylglyceryl transferase n=1 Tax=Megamonas funiformis YIT 11815 TaxID=742816 RepID=A0ABP2NHH8_9FIRM|nr:prolipoprotein diacylglyceryl transferase [Megamonas funiformis]EHR34180.1 prolipoprotein diacylglyceryl transferase [Megamonas funiformis YIT 11815]QIB60870.1 prolipoprotein diacylglyceryl transferase [Megamonas funiformis]RGJ97793.1 prolipoprotein diacylglyceryl transferase [Megamonas funiformis]RGW45352.1 prolipoprotein diacylglyceryl transferase [Megamonas funiformis]HRM59454.1 prolipoprotein diacylglyceryl transferase [Megamonas funiformis]
MHQYLFFVGDFPIRAYGLILSLSIILATGVAYFLAKQDGRWHNHIVDIGIYSGIAGIVGARLWDVFFFDWAYYSHHLSEIFYVWQGGMAIQGGIVFGVGAGIIYARHHKIDILALADIVAPAIILGQAIGRCANLLNGDAFGAPTGGNFGIIYPETTLAYHTYGAQPLWPAEVWEGQIDFVIFALLLIFRAFPHAKGQAFSLYIMLYSLARFGLEFLRGDYATPVFLSFTSAQTTSLVAFILALIFFIYCQITYSRQKKTVKSKINKNRIKNKRGY